MGTSAEAARDLDRVTEALEQARIYVAGIDQARAALDCSENLNYSPLRTLIEQALRAAEQVRAHLTGTGQTTIEPCI